MLSKFSVKKPLTVLVTVILIIILGVVSYTDMTPDLLPSIDLPYVIVMTTYVGASPEEVEETVTKPIEQSMATLSNIDTISSTSSEDYSLVILQFEDSVNMDAVTIDIRESLDTVEAAWSDNIGSPMILKINPDMMPVMVAALGAKDMNVTELSEFAENSIIPELESIEGVAGVSASGLLEQSVNVIIRQDKIDDVNKKISDAINKEMDDAEEKMQDAKDEIESGKKELEEQRKKAFDGIFDGEQKITAGQMELLKAEIQMASGEAELKAKEQELKTAEQTLKKQEKQLKKQEKQLNAAKKTAESGLQKIKDALAKIPAADVLKENKKQLEDAIAAVDANPLFTAEQKTAAKAPLEASLKEVNTAITTRSTLEAQQTKAEEGLQQINSGLASIATGKKEIRKAKTQMKAGKKELNKAKKKMAAGKAEINSGKDSLNDAAKELNSQKTQAETQMDAASDQLTAGGQQLDAQLEGFDETRKSALDAADVSGKLTAETVSQILQAQNFDMPAGYVDAEKGDSYLVRVGEKFQDADSIKNLLLFDPGIDGVDPVYMSDVADVFWVDNADETYARVDGDNGILLTFQKQTNYATADVADRIGDKFDELAEEHEGVKFSALMDQGVYIHMIIDSVINNLLVGAVLAVIILLIFLKDFRPTLIIACSIPISVIFAIVLMYFSGITLNMISMSGLAIGVGMLVDNSVVAIENIYRLRNKGVPAIKAAVTGATQVAGALLSSTLTTICVFLPIVFVKGITKQLFVDMALTIGYSLMASLVVALTVVPAMSATVLKNTQGKKHPVFDKLMEGYRKLLRLGLRFKPVMLLGALALLIGSAALAVTRGTAFMPEMDSTQISVTLQMPEDALLEDTVRMSGKIEDRIMKMEDVDSVGAMLSSNTASMMGMSMGSEDVTNVSMYVILKEDKKKTSQEIAAEIEKDCEKYDCEVTAQGSAMDMSALGGSGIQILVKGQELDKLQEIGADIAKRLEGIKGLTEISDGVDDPTPVLKVTVDKEKAMKKGLTVAQVYQALQSKMSSSKTATNLSIDGEQYDINLVSDDEEELSLEDVKKFKVPYTNTKGKSKKVKLEKIAKIEETTTLSVISREKQTRYLTVSAALKDGYNIGLVSRDVEEELDNYKMPKGYEIEFTGENETINESMFEMLKMLLLALAFIYFIMVAQFQSLRSPFIVMFTIPLAFTGGFLGLFVTGNEVSVIGMLGFVMLSGIVVNNGIVLVDYINQLRMEGMERREAIIEAGVTRMRPILMTALTTVLGLSGMAFSRGMGADMVQPIAIVEIGGLLYATLMTLFIIPALYDIFHRSDKMRFVSDEELEILDE